MEVPPAVSPTDIMARPRVECRRPTILERHLAGLAGQPSKVGARRQRLRPCESVPPAQPWITAWPQLVSPHRCYDRARLILPAIPVAAEMNWPCKTDAPVAVSENVTSDTIVFSSRTCRSD